METLFADDFLFAKQPWLPATRRGMEKRLSLRTSGVAIVSSGATSASKWVAALAVWGATTIGVADAVSPRTHYLTESAHSATTHSSTPPRELEWNTYLQRLSRPSGRFAVTQVDALRKILSHFQTQNSSLALPQTAPTDEGALAMVWDSGEHHLEVDVHPTEEVGWFYNNRATGEYQGEDHCRVGQLPKRLTEYVKKLG